MRELAEVPLPRFVDLVDWTDTGHPVLVCRNPRHPAPVEYVGRRGPRGRECPGCMAAELECGRLGGDAA